MPSSHPDLNHYASPAEIQTLIRRAMDEDLGPDHLDLTSTLLVPADARCVAAIRTRKPGYLAGAALLPDIARLYDPDIGLAAVLPDGSELQPSDVVAKVAGPLRSVLAMERIALNFLTHLSGIATLTNQYVLAIAGSRAQICDTRKTIPGLRSLAKYAVVCGGGTSHRMGLYDAVLVKDNHIAHLSLDELPKALSEMIAKARRHTPKPSFIQIEVDSLQQLSRVLPLEPDMVLLDNMTPDLLRQAVQMRDNTARRVLLEASGGVNLQSVRDIAHAGVDRISIGALTHSAPSLDLGLDIL